MTPTQKRGHIEHGQVKLSDPVEFPDGTEVTVIIYSGLPSMDTPLEPDDDLSMQLSELGVFGMWADRADMKDSVERVRQQRAQWDQRLIRSE